MDTLQLSKGAIDILLNVFEGFAGIGVFTIALREMGIDYNLIGTSEVDKYAIVSYDAIHNNSIKLSNDNLSDDEMITYLKNINVAYNFSTGKSEMPKNHDDILRLYSSCKNIKNYGDIRNIDVENLPSIDLFTYSFPCKNITNEGRQLGFEKYSGTQSSLVWNCEPMVKYKRPKYLIMENVKNIISKTNIDTFNEWCATLESYGYTNYWKIYNAKKYGIPQNRERVLMLSIYDDDSNFNVPNEIDLNISLYDLLEKNKVDEKYYIDINNTYNGLINNLRFDGEGNPIVDVREATKKGYTEATLGDSINVAHYNSKTRRGRVGHGVAQTLTTTCYQHVLEKDGSVRRLTPKECWRLQLLNDTYFDRANEIAQIPETKLYERAGRTIPITIVKAIYHNLFGEILNEKNN